MNTTVVPSKAPLTRTEIALEAKASLVRLWRSKDLIPQDGLQALGFIDPAFALDQLGYSIETVDGLADSWVDGVRSEIGASIDRVNRTITISSRCTIRELRFTLAHELGHAVLQPEFGGVHRERRLDGPTPRKDRFEREADLFAAYFLLPEAHVREEFAHRFGVGSFVLDEDSAYATFGVSLEKMMLTTKGGRGLARSLAEATGPTWNSFPSLVNTFRVSTTALAIQLEDFGLIQKMDSKF